MIRVRIAIELPNGFATELTEEPMVIRSEYRQQAREVLDRQYELAKRWLDGPGETGRG